MEFRDQRWIDDCDLATGVNHELKRAGLVDLDGNNEQGPGDNSRSEPSDVTGATHLCPAGNGRKGKCSGEKDEEGTAERWEFHVGLRSRGAS
jgi:hypothetical protein